MAKPLSVLFTVFRCKLITASSNFSKRADNTLFFLHCGHLGLVNEFSSDYHSLDLRRAFIDLKENQRMFQIISDIFLVLLGPRVLVVSVEIVHYG